MSGRNVGMVLGCICGIAGLTIVVQGLGITMTGGPMKATNMVEFFIGVGILWIGLLFLVLLRPADPSKLKQHGIVVDKLHQPGGLNTSAMLPIIGTLPFPNPVNWIDAKDQLQLRRENGEKIWISVPPEEYKFYERGDMYPWP